MSLSIDVGTDLSSVTAHFADLDRHAVQSVVHINLRNSIIPHHEEIDRITDAANDGGFLLTALSPSPTGGWEWIAVFTRDRI